VATIKDVALDAGVSTATVSRVLNKDFRVSEAKRRRVYSSIEKLDYRIHPFARTLRLGQSKTVGVIIPDMSNFFFMNLFEYMEEIFRKNGYTAVLCSSRNSVEGEVEQLSYLMEKQVEGLVVVPMGTDGTHFSPIMEQGLPIVCVDRTFIDLPADSIMVDNEEGGYKAVRALIDDGYRRIGFVGGDMTQMTCYERYLGYCRALQEAGIPLEEEFVSMSGMAMHGGYYSMKEMLSKENPPDAFFFVNLMICLGATQLIMEQPKEVQDRLVCASFDDAFFSSLLHRCRYFVSQPVEEIGVLAANTVLNRLNRKEAAGAAKTIRLNTELIQITHKEV